MDNRNGVRVVPLAQRASWARRPSIFDHPAPSRGLDGHPEPRARFAMSPEVQQVCERIEKGVESLLEAIGQGHKLWIRGGCNEADREALQAAAALVGRRLGKPVR